MTGACKRLFARFVKFYKWVGNSEIRQNAHFISHFALRVLAYNPDLC